MEIGIWQRILRQKWKWVVVVLLMAAGFFVPYFISVVARMFYVGCYTVPMGEKWRICYLKHFPPKESAKRPVFYNKQGLEFKKTGIKEVDDLYEECMDYQVLLFGMGITLFISLVFSVF